jgi:arginyl-tRNA synthetase
MPQQEFLTYKGKPLVRKGSEIYYGDMAEKYVILFKIQSTKKVGELEVADKILVQLMDTDQDTDVTKRIVKKSEKNGLYNAMDIGYIWLERALKQ